MNDVPHIDWPIRLNATGYQTCQQDTAQELAAAVTVVCSFERGSRIEAPDFGITDPTFSQMPIDTTDLEQQLAALEPRADVTVELTGDAAGEQQVRLNVNVASVPEGVT